MFVSRPVGNIRVFCRVRPTIREDGEGAAAAHVVSHDLEDDGVIHVTFKSRDQSFELDKAFDASVSQQEVGRKLPLKICRFLAVEIEVNFTVSV